MVLVTGATGFLGSELISQLLQSGIRVRALKRDSSVIPEMLKNESSIEWIDADLLDYFALEEALDGVGKVYHCGAYISFNPLDNGKMLQVNVEGTSNLLNACLEKNIAKFLHVSSVAAVGESKNNEPITEKDHWEFGSGQSGYSVSKYKSEMEVFRAGAEGLNVIIVNPSIIIGKNAGTQGSGQLFETIRKGINYYPGGSAGYVDVADVARIMILLMESEISGERFILNAENWTYKDFFTELAHQFGKKPPQIALKPWMLKLASLGFGIKALFTGKKNTLTRDTIKSAFKKQNYSNDKIKKALNLEFRSVKDSISEICVNFKQ